MMKLTRYFKKSLNILNFEMVPLQLHLPLKRVTKLNNKRKGQRSKRHKFEVK